jgi:hypothetical protein
MLSHFGGVRSPLLGPRSPFIFLSIGVVSKFLLELCKKKF